MLSASSISVASGWVKSHDRLRSRIERKGVKLAIVAMPGRGIDHAIRQASQPSLRIRNGGKKGFSEQPSDSLVIYKEEQLIFLDGTTERAPELILADMDSWGDAVVLKIITGIENVVAEESHRREPWKIVCSRAAWSRSSRFRCRRNVRCRNSSAPEIRRSPRHRAKFR